MLAVGLEHVSEPIVCVTSGDGGEATGAGIGSSKCKV